MMKPSTHRECLMAKAEQDLATMRAILEKEGAFKMPEDEIEVSNQPRVEQIHFPHHGTDNDDDSVSVLGTNTENTAGVSPVAAVAKGKESDTQDIVSLSSLAKIRVLIF